MRDSVVEGKVIVEKGASFSMNYNDYEEGSYLNGASINGQLLLKDGAILKNSVIYSNTNFIANGDEVRKNVEPVVVTEGNVMVSGNVYIKGDEAPTGNVEGSTESYPGQTALKVRGTLSIPEDVVLAVYGGGKDATTANGGTAVSGSGSIEVAEFYLEGGNAYMPKDESISGGQAATSGIVLSKTSKCSLINGKRITTNSEVTSNTYWRNITSLPDLSN